MPLSDKDIDLFLDGKKPLVLDKDIDAFLDGKMESEGLWSGLIKPTMKAIPKVGGALAGGLLSFPAAGIGGLARLISSGGDIQQASETVQGIAGTPMRLMTTPEEEKAADYILKPIEKISESAKWWGDKVFEKTNNPTLSALVSSGIEAAVFLGLPGAKAKLIKDIKAGKLINAQKLARELEAQKRIKVIEQEKTTVPIQREMVKEKAPLPREGRPRLVQPEGITEKQKQLGSLKEAEAAKEAAKIMREEAVKIKPPKEAKPTPLIKRESVLGEKAPLPREGRPKPRVVEPETIAKVPEQIEPEFISKTVEPEIKPTLKAKEPSGMVVRTEGVTDKASQSVDIRKSLTKEDSVYRGMTESEYNNTIGNKGTVESSKDYSFSKEGTSFGEDFDTAESYVNYGRDDPRVTGRPTYIVEVKKGDNLTRNRQGYYEAKDPIPKEQIERVWKMEGKGDDVVATIVEPTPKAKEPWDLQAIKPLISEKGAGFLPTQFAKEVGKGWEEKVGGAVWDKFIMKSIPKALEKVPGGKAINRAFLYAYRGNLPHTETYIKSFEHMKLSQALGREYAIDLGKRLQAFPEDAQMRMGEFLRGELDKLPPDELKTATEAKNVLIDLGKQSVDVGLLGEETFFKNVGKYMPRLYTSKEYQSLLTKWGIVKPNRLDLTRFKKRKDIPIEQRKKMGEILTPGYPVAKGIIQLTHDIELSKLFNGIASKPEWAIPKTPKVSEKTGKPVGYKKTIYDPFTGKPIEKWIQKTEYGLPIPEGWKKLPDTKKLGKLNDAYVHPEIFRDIEEAIRVMGEGEKIWRKALGSWKFGKVILSPKTHSRNLMSNSILAHLGGLPMYEQPIYLTKAMKAMRGKTEYWKQAKDQGLMRETFTNAELRLLFDQVENQIEGIKAGSIPEAMGKVGQIWDKAKIGMNKAAKLYEAEEQWFKIAKFIHNVERKKMPIDKAARDAEKWLFNYSKITKFQEKFRSKWYGAPFATFTFKALPRITEAAIKTPWRFALPVAMIYGLEEAARSYIGDTKEQTKAKAELKKPYMKTFMDKLGAGWTMWPRVPVIDDHGREYYLNLTYILPWGDIAEGGGFGPIPGGVMPFTQPFLKEPVQQIANYDWFWKAPIVEEKELAGKSTTGKLVTEAKIRGGHLAQAMVPTPAIDISKAISAVRTKPDYKGRLKAPGTVAADVLAGVKMYPVDYAEEAQRFISKNHPTAGGIAREIRTDIKRLAIQRATVAKKGGDISYYNDKISEKIKQLQGLGKEVMKLGETYKKKEGPTRRFSSDKEIDAFLDEGRKIR